MSINNQFRTQLKNEINSRVYKILSTINQDPYFEDSEVKHFRRNKKRWSKKHKLIPRWNYRVYRTWKYNRITKYKMKKTNDFT